VSDDKKRIAEQFLRVGSSGPERAIRELFSDGDHGMVNLQPVGRSPPPPVAVVVACECGQRNRVRLVAGAEGKKPCCGRCRKVLVLDR
jgi:hypothetical protein